MQRESNISMAVDTPVCQMPYQVNLVVSFLPCRSTNISIHPSIYLDLFCFCKGLLVFSEWRTKSWTYTVERGQPSFLQKIPALWCLILHFWANQWWGYCQTYYVVHIYSTLPQFPCSFALAMADKEKINEGKSSFFFILFFENLIRCLLP